MSENKSSMVLGQYKGFKVPAIDLDVPQSEVDEIVESERQRLADIKTIDTPSVNGNVVNIDFDAYMGGKKIKGEGDKHIDVELGQGNFLAEVEKELLGVKAGDEKEVKVVLSKEYYAPEFADQEIVFKIKVNEVCSKTYPEFTPAFLMANYGTEDYEELLDAIREGIRERKLVAGKEKLKDKLVDMIIESSTLDYDDNLLKLAIFEQKTQYIKQMEDQGINFEEYVAKYGIDTSFMEGTWRKAAQKQVGHDLVLREIAKREGLIATDEEVDERINEMALKYKVAPLLVKGALEGGKMEELRDEISENKALDFVLDHVIFE